MALTGDLSDFDVANVLQLPYMGHMTGRLVINSASRSASLFYETGRLVHAETDGALGEQALVPLLALEDGRFEFEFGTAAPSRTIERDLHQALMLAAQELDEMTAAEGEGEAPPSSGIDAKQLVSDFLAQTGSALAAVLFGEDNEALASAGDEALACEVTPQAEALLATLRDEDGGLGFARLILEGPGNRLVLAPVRGGPGALVTLFAADVPLGNALFALSKAQAVLDDRPPQGARR